MNLSLINGVLMLLPVVVTIWLVVVSLGNGIGPVPTSSQVKCTVTTLLPQQVQGDIIELGAGWGGMALLLARFYPGNRVIALENNLPVFLICWLRVKLSGLENITVKYGDIYQYTGQTSRTNRGAGLIYCYLCTTAMEQLANCLPKQPRGLTLITNTFTLPGWQAEVVREANDLWRSRIYCYRIPAR